MASSPFIYGNTVSNGSFTNREVEVEKLRSNLLNGINTMIISPRRWGKSSLVEKVILEITKKEKNHKVIIIDLFFREQRRGVFGNLCARGHSGVF